MIKQLIDIDGYWEVIVYYNIDYNFFDDIIITITDTTFDACKFSKFSAN